MLSTVLTVHVSLVLREKSGSPDTCAAGVTTQSTDVLALVKWVLCAAAASSLSHVAFVSKLVETNE